jgi:hypothetical protein
VVERRLHEQLMEGEGPVTEPHRDVRVCLQELLLPIREAHVFQMGVQLQHGFVHDVPGHRVPPSGGGPTSAAFPVDGDCRMAPRTRQIIEVIAANSIPD